MRRIPESIVARTHELLNESKPEAALLLLMQIFPARTADAITSKLVALADETRVSGDLDQAKDYYYLATVLFEKTTPQSHAVGVHAIRNVSEILTQQGKQRELQAFLDRTRPLVLDIARRAIREQPLAAGG